MPTFMLHTHTERERERDARARTQTDRQSERERERERTHVPDPGGVNWLCLMLLPSAEEPLYPNPVLEPPELAAAGLLPALCAAETQTPPLADGAYACDGVVTEATGTMVPGGPRSPEPGGSKSFRYTASILAVGLFFPVVVT